MITITEKKNLIAKEKWDYHDIAKYCECGTTKAIQIKNQAVKDYGGAIRYMSQYVTVDSVMKCLGTTREREIEILKMLEELEETEN